MKYKLSVRNFSCIDSADIELAMMTFLIGPQASGKSVLSKLAYFCLETPAEMMSAVYTQYTIEDHKAKLEAKFKHWFPVSGWGEKNFRIKLSAGKFTVEFSRVRSDSGATTDVAIKFARYADKLYTEYAQLMSVADMESPTTSPARRIIDHKNRIASEFMERVTANAGPGLIAWQIFIPAGRSFFTSQYKTASTFSKFETLEPLLTEFGRLYGFVRERQIPNSKQEGGESASRTISSPIIEKLLGGEVILQKETAYLLAKDGRTLPFSFLSSGQQELLPLLLILQIFALGGSLTYIEEPEAHLFPESQSILLKHLVSLANGAIRAPSPATWTQPKLFITTHSPYVLARINNLVKAGQIGSNLDATARKRAEKVIPRDAWIYPDTISAYAIESGKVRSIVNDDGFINADYLDNVSDDISRELAKLIQIEIDLLEESE